MEEAATPKLARQRSLEYRPACKNCYAFSILLRILAEVLVGSSGLRSVQSGWNALNEDPIEVCPLCGAFCCFALSSSLLRYGFGDQGPRRRPGPRVPSVGFNSNCYWMDLGPRVPNDFR